MCTIMADVRHTTVGSKIRHDAEVDDEPWLGGDGKRPLVVEYSTLDRACAP